MSRFSTETETIEYVEIDTEEMYYRNWHMHIRRLRNSTVCHLLGNQKSQQCNSVEVQRREQRQGEMVQVLVQVQRLENNEHQGLRAGKMDVLAKAKSNKFTLLLFCSLTKYVICVFCQNKALKAINRNMLHWKKQTLNSIDISGWRLKILYLYDT